MIDPDIHAAPTGTTARTLRQFAGLSLLVFGGLAGWYGVQNRPGLALVLVSLGVVIGAVGLTRPRAIEPLFTALTILTYPVGWVVSRMLLGFLYYGMFTPLALLFRLIGRDALLRRERPDRASHWVVKPESTDVRAYFRES